MSEAKKFSTASLANKVDREGGVLATLEYGVRADEIEDPQLRSLWEQVETGYRALTPLVTAINLELRKAA
jgi:hypothetical protein